MTVFSRTDISMLGRWWWTIDRWVLASVAILLGFGVIMALAATPSVAIRLGHEPLHFAIRHMVFVPVAVAVLLGTSLLSPRGVLRVATIVLAISTILVLVTLVAGVDNRGARRWINLGVIALQPSEFLKPAFAVVTAWMFAATRNGTMAYGNLLSLCMFGVLMGLLLMQPDVGMSVVIAVVWASQFFLAGLPVIWVVCLGITGICGMIAAYNHLPHVASRFDRFLDPSSGDSYQVDQSLQSFARGGLFGRGPGEGTVKQNLPDGHSDFVFAVAGEEFGILVCLAVVVLFAFIVLRSFARILQETDLFVFVASAGLLIQFGLQAIINMGSTLRMMPTKGMTLPFVSYGGSSLIAVSICIGLILALTRRRTSPRALP